MRAMPARLVRAKLQCWDETSQPPSRPSMTSGLETSRLHTPTPSKPTPSLGRDVPAPIHTLNDFGGGDVPSPASHALETNTLWDETSQPLPAASITSGLETSRLHTPTPSKPTPSGTRRPSPDPHHKLLRGWRRPVSTRPTPSQRPSSVRDFPCPSPTRLQNPERGFRQ